MIEQHGFSYVTLAVTNAYQSAGVNIGAAEPDAEPVPSRGVLDTIDMGFDTVAGGATSVTWYLSDDADGKKPLTPERTDTLDDGKSAGFPVLSLFIGRRYRKSALRTTSNLWLCMKTDAGTVNLKGWLNWKQG